jgi:hypothetical protein
MPTAASARAAARKVIEESANRVTGGGRDVDCDARLDRLGQVGGRGGRGKGGLLPLPVGRLPLRPGQGALFGLM